MKKTWIIVLVVAVVLFGAVVAYAHPFNNDRNDSRDEWFSDREEWLDEQVQDGNLTRAEANEMYQWMEEREERYCLADDDDDDTFLGRFFNRSSSRVGMFGGCFR